MGTEPIEALQVALKQVPSGVASLGLNSIIDSNGNHWITSSIANANAIAGCEQAPTVFMGQTLLQGGAHAYVYIRITMVMYMGMRHLAVVP